MSPRKRNPRLVLVEGPDGAGKTTLIRAMRDLLPIPPFTDACGVPQGPPLREYIDKAMTAWWDGSWNVIFDRFHIGEQVYGPIMRGEDKLGDIGRGVLEEYLKSIFDPVVVLARPPFQACREAWSQRLDEEYVPDEERMLRVWEAFGSIKTTLPVVPYDRTQDSVERLMRKVFV